MSSDDVLTNSLSRPLRWDSDGERRVTGRLTERLERRCGEGIHHTRNTADSPRFFPLFSVATPDFTETHLFKPAESRRPMKEDSDAEPEPRFSHKAFITKMLRQFPQRSADFD